MRLRRTLIPALVILVALATISPVLAQMGPEVVAEDQDVTDGTVTIATVVTEGPGWIVIHKDEDGAPGPVIGHAAVEDGENSDVVVTLDEELMGETTLWAMLHTDAGTAGTYEFPGDDGPVQDAEGNIVQDPFVATPGMMDDAMEGEEGESMEGESMEDESMEGESMEGESMSEGEAPETLPETGAAGSNTLTASLLTFAAGVILLAGAFAIHLRRRVTS